MKKIHKVLLMLFLFNFLCISILKKNGISFDSWVIAAIGSLLFFIPLIVLLFLIGKDPEINKSKRIVAISFAVFILFCYLMGGVFTFNQ